jgi:hypothetical protein
MFVAGELSLFPRQGRSPRRPTAAFTMGLSAETSCSGRLGEVALPSRRLRHVHFRQKSPHGHLQVFPEQKHRILEIAAFVPTAVSSFRYEIA